MLYGIAKGSIMGSVLSSMSWPWGIGILIPAGCPAKDIFTPTGYIATGVL